MSDEPIRPIEKFFEVKRYAYYSFFYLVSLLFFFWGVNAPYTIEYKISNVLLWSVMILVIPDALIKIFEVLVCIKERISERLN